MSYFQDFFIDLPCALLAIKFLFSVILIHIIKSHLANDDI